MTPTKPENNTDKALIMQAFIAEFNALRQAIRARTDAGQRFNIFIISFLGVILSLAVYNTKFLVFIIIPYVLTFLYMKKIEDDRIMDVLKIYIQDELGEQMRLLTNEDAILQFEKYIEKNRNKPGGRKLSLISDIFIFSITPFIAIIVSVFGIDSGWHTAVYISIGLVLFITTILVAFILVHQVKRYRIRQEHAAKQPEKISIID